MWPFAALAVVPAAGRARSRTTRSRGWRSRSRSSPCRASLSRWRAAPGARRRLPGADDAAGDRAQVQRGREQRPRGGRSRTSCSTASSARSTRSSATRGRAACWRRPTAGTCCRTGQAARCTSARCRGRRTGTQRVRETRALFEGDMGAAEAQELARRSGARFAFVDCRPGLRDLRPLLGPLIERVDRYGCATVYDLRLTPAPRCSSARGADLGRHGARRHPAQRRGPDAPGGRADRRRPGPVLATSGGSTRPASRCCSAGCGRLLGPSLLPWRVVRVLVRRARGAAGLAAGACAAARRRWAALAAWLAAALAMAYPSGPHPFPMTLALALGALLLLRAAAGARRASWPGVAAFWRLEFAAYLALGVLLGYAVRARAAARRRGSRAAAVRRRCRPVRAGGGAGRASGRRSTC